METFLTGAESPKKFKCTKVMSSGLVFSTTALIRVLPVWLRVMLREARAVCARARALVAAMAKRILKAAQMA